MQKFVNFCTIEHKADVWSKPPFDMRDVLVKSVQNPNSQNCSKEKTIPLNPNIFDNFISSIIDQDNTEHNRTTLTLADFRNLQNSLIMLSLVNLFSFFATIIFSLDSWHVIMSSSCSQSLHHPFDV